MVGNRNTACRIIPILQICIQSINADNIPVNVYPVIMPKGDKATLIPYQVLYLSTGAYKLIHIGL